MDFRDAMGIVPSQLINTLFILENGSRRAHKDERVEKKRSRGTRGDMSYIDVRHEVKRYRSGDTEILANNDVSFSVEKGELAVILGASGAGKSTLLNILGGMDTASEGEVWIDGNNIATYSSHQLTNYRRTDVGFVFQFYNLVSNLTAKENVELASQIVDDAADPVKTLEDVGLGHRVNNFPAQLSGGEQQRVAIARALVNNPSMIIADEPTGNLDPQRSLEIMMLLERINELGTTVLVVTHEKALVNRFTKRVVAIENGRIISDETGGYYNAEKI